MKAARTREGRLPRARGEETRARILAAALARFRKKGFEPTTMREIADDAKVALGAAYYYFPSKEAIVVGYYEETQRLCSSKAREAFAETTDTRKRLGAAIHTKLDVLARDRKLLAALFRSVADPSSEISVFSETARNAREDSIRIFDEALETAPEVNALAPEARRVLVLALWSLHMGLLLYFIRDTSKGAARTHALTDRTLDLLCTILPLAPMIAPTLGTTLGQILSEAGLLD